jgi:hypothetical protein
MRATVAILARSPRRTATGSEQIRPVLEEWNGGIQSIPGPRLLADIMMETRATMDLICPSLLAMNTHWSRPAQREKTFIVGDEPSLSRWATFRSNAVSYNCRFDFLPRKPTNPLCNVSGWRMGIRVASGAILGVPLTNIVLTLVARFAFPYYRYESTLIDGSCSGTKTTGTWLHLGINILSSILLSASSYAMQCLSSPTRKEVDNAHTKGDYLDIGIPSIHNLTRVDRKRVILWILLALSSLPIHLLYFMGPCPVSIGPSDICLVSTRPFMKLSLQIHTYSQLLPRTS